MNVLKPFLMLACVAFVTGFMGYLAMARMSARPAATASATAATESWSSTVSEPVPAVQEWNVGKRI